MKPNELLSIIDKNEFVSYYLIHTITDTANKFCISKKEAVGLVHSLKLTKTKEQKAESISNADGGRKGFYERRTLKTMETACERYGSVDNLHKIAHERSVASGIKKHGSIECYNKFLHDNAVSALKSKYGVENPSQLQFVNDKKKQTMIKNYGSLDKAYEVRNMHSAVTYLEKTGFEHNMKNPEVRQKVVNTFMKRYGVNTPFKSEAVKEKIRNTNLSRYGVAYCCQLADCNVNSIHSVPNDSFANMLFSHGLEFKREFALDRYCYDFKVGKFLIEIDPYATHNVDWSPYSNSNGVLRNYHAKKSKCAFNNDYVCIHVFDWTSIDAVLVLLRTDKSVSVKFTEPRLHIFNYKKKSIVDIYEKDCVNIYDDGEDVYLDEVLYYL